MKNDFIPSMIMGGLIGVLIASICWSITVRKFKTKAIEANVAEYIIDSKTGDSTFIFTNKIK